MLVENPTPKDVQTYVFFAINKPSNMPLESACSLAAIQFGLTAREVKGIVFKQGFSVNFSLKDKGEIH